MQRVKINEPVWSAPTGKECARQDIAPRRTKPAHAPFDCANCTKARCDSCKSELNGK